MEFGLVASWAIFGYRQTTAASATTPTMTKITQKPHIIPKHVDRINRFPFSQCWVSNYIYFPKLVCLCQWPHCGEKHTILNCQKTTMIKLEIIIAYFFDLTFNRNQTRHILNEAISIASSSHGYKTIRKI